MASQVPITGTFSYGTMSMTWTPEPLPFDQAIDSIKYAIDKYNVHAINGGIFYGGDAINLKLLSEFWQKHGSNYPNVVFSFKGGFDAAAMAPNGTREFIHNELKLIEKFFPKNNRPKILYQVARVDMNTPFEDTTKFIAEGIKDGIIDGISLSEVGINSIRKAVSVHPISCVELELSLMCQDIVQNGILEELSKLKIPVVAYSPLHRGWLTDYAVKDLAKFHESCKRPGDIRAHLDRFSDENFDKNNVLVKKLHEYAHSKNVSLETLALLWIIRVSGAKNYQGIPEVTRVLPIASGTTREKIDRNLGNTIELTEEDLKNIKEITDTYKVHGYRYTKEMEALCFA